MEALTVVHYDAGSLVKATIDPRATPFLAISHVWGIAEWCRIDCFSEEILVSNEKAKFLTEKLPSIVGSEYFWMDVLCVDQRDGDTRVAVTQHIPRIFRLAQRTIAVRESCGFRNCCTEAIGDKWDFYDKGEGSGRRELREHLHQAHATGFSEGMLTRLWPLQEMLLSKTIQFVQCDVVSGNVQHIPATLAMDALYIEDLAAELSNLGIAWSDRGSPTGNEQGRGRREKTFLVSALLNLGTVTRIYEENEEVVSPAAFEILMHISSTRASTKSRDFILAVMPQYNFYQVPPNARRMTFSELFLDCVRQLRAVDIAVATLFAPAVDAADGMITGDEIDIPEPTSLGDLVKLLNGPVFRVGENRTLDLQTVQTSWAIIDHAEVDRIAALIESDLSPLAARTMAENVLMVHALAVSVVRSNYLWRICWDEIQRQLGSTPVASRKGRVLKTAAMLCSYMDYDKSPRANAVWLTQETDLMDHLKTTPCDAVILVTAMISCGVPLSAFEWCEEQMSPIRVLIDRHAFIALAPKQVVREDTMFCVLEVKDWELGRDGPAPRLALLAINTAIEEGGCFYLGAFPPDISPLRDLSEEPVTQD